MTQPMTLAERRAKRAEIRRKAFAQALAQAEEWALSAERSMKCSARYNPLTGPAHSDRPGGCANDGSNCLCECHDPG